MPDYGVDTPAWSPLPWAWAAERLVAGRNYWVVTASAAGRPHAMPVWGVWSEEDGAFAFSCGPHSRKVRNLAANPQVAVLGESTVECISIEGRAAVLDDAGRVEAWIGRYVDKYRVHYADISADFLRQHVTVEVTPERALAVVEREEEFATRATRWVFGA